LKRRESTPDPAAAGGGQRESGRIVELGRGLYRLAEIGEAARWPALQPKPRLELGPALLLLELPSPFPLSVPAAALLEELKDLLLA
jgi:hypothetical protein